jgi:GntR family transcriptional regulator of vanillate catabolism
MPNLVEDVTLQLRDWIVSGELKPGSRIPERELAERLGVSRTPVKLALSNLEAEGLVSGATNRSYVVSAFNEEDILSAFEVRGALEGLAAKAATERGLSEEVLASLRACLAEGEALIRNGLCDAQDMRRWSASNGVFHDTVIGASSLPSLSKVHAFMSRMPLVAPIAILFTSDEQDGAQARMAEAHDDHVHIVDAMSRGQSARAEYLMREHAYRSREHLARLLREGRTIRGELSTLAHKRGLPEHELRS